MALSPKVVKAQLALVQPLLSSCSLKTIRKGQNKIGEIMGSKFKNQVMTKVHSFDDFDGAWIIPKDERRQGVILYLHGGGYTCGDLEYATGFAATLATRYGCRVFCPAYRLAPEHPFPAAPEDAVTAYQYLLHKGFTHIILCGESAGGGLCYSLALQIKQLGLTAPSGIIAISPWVDLTLSGETFHLNREKDVSLSYETVRYYAECYTDRPENVLASPLFGDLTGLPPSLIYAGEEEILLSDATRLHEKLLTSGSKSELIVAADRWHAYLLYGLEEDQKAFDIMEGFLNRYMGREQKLRWMRLDNAAKIYPAARNQEWSNIYRLSATLTEKVDTEILSKALDITVRRFPSIAVRLRRGVFWYYLEHISEAPPIRQEYAYPLTRMDAREMRQYAFRVIVHDKRVAIEMFHAITDGGGALVFLKSLIAEYLQQRYGISIPAECGVLGRLESPREEELEDSFPKYAGPVTASRKDSTAWHLTGTTELDGFQHFTGFTLSSQQVRQKAKEYGVTVTCFLGAVMLMALQDMQAEKVSNPKHRKPLKVLLPINLRSIFPSNTLRNFSYFTIPEIDPRMGTYDFEEICRVVKHRMGMDFTAKQLSSRIATNVNSEKLLIVRLMPLPIKNLVMKAIFKSVGECKCCLNLSNLGHVQLPKAMQPYVQRLDAVLGVQASAPYNCAVISYGDQLNINFTRDIRESELEYRFFRVLQRLGLQARVDSNSNEV